MTTPPPEQALAASSRGPRWTRRRLLNALMAAYGVDERGRLDVDSVAAGFGVKGSTVRRWVAGSSGRVRARIPAKRLQQLVQPPADVIEREKAVTENARRAVAGMHLPRGRARLRQQDWLEPHLVAVLALPAEPGGGIELRQIVLTRGTPRQVDRLRRRGDIIDFTTVPTRYHAVALIGDVMDIVGPWRLFPGENIATDSRTQTWAHDAPRFNLATMATALEPQLP